MAKIPDDIIEGIKKLAETSGTPVKTLLERLKKIKETNENIKTMEKDDFKIRFAWAVLLKEFTSSGNEYYIRPICYPRVRETVSKGEKIKVGDLTALIQKINKKEDGTISLGKVQYGSGTFWRDAAKNMETLEVGKVYKASLIANENSWGSTITSNNTLFVPADFKMNSFREFFDENIKPQNPMITIEEMDMSKSDTPTDIKIIKGTITESDVRKRNDGSEYGYYDVTDNSVLGTKNQRIFVDTKDVLYEQGSIVLFGGHIAFDDEGKIRWTHHFQIPTKTSEKKEIKIVPPKADEIDVDLDLDDGTEQQEEDQLENDKKSIKKETEPPTESSDDDELNFEV